MEKLTDEIQKAIDDPLYFYNNFYRPEGFPEINQEEYDKMITEAKILANGGFRIRNRRTGYTYFYKMIDSLPDFLKQHYGLTKTNK